MRPAALYKIEDLQDWFMRMDRPYWKLYIGIRNVASFKPTERTDVNENISTTPEAWDLLEKAIEFRSMSGGDFTIVIDSTKKFNHALYTGLSIERGGGSTEGISGIPGVGAKNVESYVAGVVAKEMQLYDLKRENDDLHEALQEKQAGTGVERFANKIIEHPKLDQLLDIALIRFMGGGNTPAQVGMQGFSDTQEEVVEIDPMPYLERIQKIFPDIEAFLKKLTEQIEGNPAMAKAMFFQKEESKTETNG